MTNNHLRKKRCSYKAGVLITILIIASAHAISQQSDKKMLTNLYAVEFLNDNITAPGNFFPFPKYGDEAWKSVPDDIRAAYIAEGEKLLGEKWEAVPAMLFTEFRKNGNRSRYEFLSFLRRDKLIKLVLAELLEQEGRFMNDIVNGIWVVSEETWWGTSAHYGPNLPDVQRVQEVDLMHAETASMMALIKYLLHDELNKVSPLISRRISYEVERRMLVPCMTQKFWWMNAGMNWNPWIVSNWLMCLLLEEQDQGKRSDALVKIFSNLDSFIDSYHDDGGCDEGAAYWSRAAGAMFDCLDWLSRGSNGKIDIFSQPKIKEMGRFIGKMYITDEYFVNFADTRPRMSPDVAQIYRYGKTINDSMMMKFAAYNAGRRNFFEGKNNINHRPFLGGMNRVLSMLLQLNEFKSIENTAVIERDHWLPNLQVMTARSSLNAKEGLFLAMKGGHNAEAHNHNDVGNFIVYGNGKPVIIDVGVGTYERNTFNHMRYTIWTMQSLYHNTPVINGVAQKDGKEFSSKDVKYSQNNREASMSMDISNAYPKEAQVITWNRRVRLIRNKEIVVNEEFELLKHIVPSEIILMTSCEVEILNDRIKLSNGDDIYFIHFDPKICRAFAEKITLEDPSLISFWGDKLYRMKLVVKGNNLRNSIKYTIKKQGA
jgi:hypothetical protein